MLADFQIAAGDTRLRPIEFSVRCNPPTANHQNKKIVTIRGKSGKTFSKLADDAELVKARRSWTALFAPHQPRVPMPGPVALTLDFTWPWRKGDAESTRQKGRLRKTSAPDLTNVAKTVEDVLAMLRFIENDAEVAELRVRKFHGSKPGLLVRIEPLDDFEEQR